MLTADVVEYLIDLHNDYMEMRSDTPLKTMEQFLKFMDGQTVSVFDGKTLYYLCDVNRFLRNLGVAD